MVNNDRIVPIMKIDFLSLIGTVLGLLGTTYSVLEATDIEGDFSVTGSGAAGNFLANQPVKSLDFPTAVTGATVYFVPALDFIEITKAETAVTPSGDDIVADGITLYKAVLSSGTVTVTAITPSVSE